MAMRARFAIHRREEDRGGVSRRRRASGDRCARRLGGEGRLAAITPPGFHPKKLPWSLR